MSKTFILFICGMALMMVGINLFTNLPLSKSLPAPSPQSDRNTPARVVDGY